MSEIASRHNAKFKAWLALLEAKGIKKAGLALISGRKLTAEVQRLHPGACVDVIGSSKDDTPGITQRLAPPLFKELDSLGTRAPLLLVKVPKLNVWKNEPPIGLELVVALSDPGNLGAILRSAEAFGANRVILTQEACSPFLPKALRASAGAALRLNMCTTGPLKDISLKGAFALDMEGENLIHFRWPRDLHLVLGEEGRGVPKELGLKPLSIPMSGSTESLNATTAASIALFTYKSHW